MKRRGLHGSLLIAVVTTVSAVLAGRPALSVRLELDRGAILDGEFWRLATGHLVHWSGAHVFWDAAVFAGLGLAAARLLGSGRLALALLASVLAVSGTVLCFQPSLEIYRGLSGVDSMLFGVVVVSALRRDLARGDRFGITMLSLLLAGFVAKSIVEWTLGAALFAGDGNAAFVPVPLAHLVGVGVGAPFSIRPK